MNENTPRRVWKNTWTIESTVMGCMESCDENCQLLGFQAQRRWPSRSTDVANSFLLQISATALSIQAVGTPIRLQIGTFSTAVRLCRENKIDQVKTYYCSGTYATWALHNRVQTTTHGWKTQNTRAFSTQTPNCAVPCTGRCSSPQDLRWSQANAIMHDCTQAPAQQFCHGTDVH